MMTGLTSWFRGRSQREQRLLLAMLAVAAVVLAWVALVRPLGDGLASARERHGAAVVALAEARGQAEQIRLLEQRRPTTAGEPLPTLVGNAASEAGFQLSRLEPQPGGGVLVAIEAAKPEALFGWVAQMEGPRGLIVDRLNATANADRTLAVQVTFRTRGS